MYYISVEECIKINKWAIENYGYEFGILDYDKLVQCLEIPKQVIFGTEIHSSIEKKAAAYLYYLTVSHPFVDGNKRTAFLTCYIFLRKNGYNLKAKQEDIVNFIISIADGKESLDSVYNWILSRI